MSVDQVTYKGYTIRIESDEGSGANPLDWSNLGTMVCFNSRYSIGDDHEFANPDAFREFRRNTKMVVLPLFTYIHGGITINTTGFSCPWDSGQAGWIYVTHDKIREEYRWKKLTKTRLARIEKHLFSEVKTYDDFLTGDVYGYRIDGLDDDTRWGFYGYDHEASGLMGEARADVNFVVAEKLEAKLARLAQVKAWIKNRVPLYARVV